MRTPDIGSLVTGILAVVGIALALGQYGRLETWARNQAIEAMSWKRGLPYFFAPVGNPRHKAMKAGHRAGHPVPTAVGDYH